MVEIAMQLKKLEKLVKSTYFFLLTLLLMLLLKGLHRNILIALATAMRLDDITKNFLKYPTFSIK
jgi:branched-subunit amino acid transport protein